MFFKRIAQCFTVQQLLKSSPLLVAIGFVAATGLAWIGNVAMNRDTNRVSLLRTQRMLNERQFNDLLQISRGESVDTDWTRQAINISMAALMNGGNSELGMIRPVTNAQVRGLLDQQQELFANGISLADEMAAAVQNGGDVAALLAEAKANVVRGRQLNADAINTLHAEQQADSRTQFIWSISTGFALLTISSLVMWAICRVVMSQFIGQVHQLKQISTENSRQLCSDAKSTALLAAENTTQSSAAAKQVKSSAEAVASAIELFESSIKEIMQNTSLVAATAREAVDVVGETTDTVTRLKCSSAQIDSVIRAISKIAEQTNLLALNATIEAARAGEAGKGFAVVAKEVKELAEETARASDEIIRQVEAIRDDANKANDGISQVRTVIDQICEGQDTVACAVNEQVAMTTEISKNINEVTTSIISITDGITVAANITDDVIKHLEKAVSTGHQINVLTDSFVERLTRSIDRDWIPDAPSVAVPTATSGKYRVPAPVEHVFSQSP